MAETLGEKLRAAREERGVSISDVAEQTRIAPMYLECIENDNYKPLPGGIFNKGFVKSYARFIGFDEQEALQEYGKIARQNEADDADEIRAYRPEVLTDDRSGPSLVPTIIFAGIILSLLTGGVLFLLNYLQNQPTTPVANTESETNQNTGVPDPSLQPSAPGAVPTMADIRVEFRTVSDPISLSATSDGKSSINTVTPTNPQFFEPRESLTLSFAKSLAGQARLLINGKEIGLPTQPANPRRIPIEIEINSSNLSQIWNEGAISFETIPASTETPASVATPSTVSDTPGAAATETPDASTPRPASPTPRATTTRSPSSNANARRPSPTPIVVGNRNPTSRPTPD